MRLMSVIPDQEQITPDSTYSQRHDQRTKLLNHPSSNIRASTRHALPIMHPPIMHPTIMHHALLIYPNPPIAPALLPVPPSRGSNPKRKYNCASRSEHRSKWSWIVIEGRRSWGVGGGEVGDVDGTEDVDVVDVIEDVDVVDVIEDMEDDRGGSVYVDIGLVVEYRGERDDEAIAA